MALDDKQVKPMLLSVVVAMIVVMLVLTVLTYKACAVSCVSPQPPVVQVTPGGYTHKGNLQRVGSLDTKSPVSGLLRGNAVPIINTGNSLNPFHKGGYYANNNAFQGGQRTDPVQPSDNYNLSGIGIGADSPPAALAPLLQDSKRFGQTLAATPFTGNMPSYINSDSCGQQWDPSAIGEVLALQSLGVYPVGSVSDEPTFGRVLQNASDSILGNNSSTQLNASGGVYGSAKAGYRK